MQNKHEKPATNLQRAAQRFNQFFSEGLSIVRHMLKKQSWAKIFALWPRNGFTAFSLVLLLAACGSDGNSGTLTIFAGSLGTYGRINGNGAAASFTNPHGLATDSAGNVYVADTGSQLIRKITPSGVVSTLAGSGSQSSANGTGTAASFDEPYGVATDSAGNVYVADSYNHLIRKITSAGVVTTLAGTAGAAGHADGTGTAASFNFPSGVATDSADNVYVADSVNYLIRKITPAGVVTTLAGTAGVSGHANGTGTAATFSNIVGLAIDSTGNIYVADELNNLIRMITPTGVVTTLAGSGANGSADGTGTAATFSNPASVATDSTGNVYVVDQANNLRKITPTGVVTTLAGTAGVTGSADGSGAAARFNFPAGLATDSAGNIYVGDTSNNIIRKVTPAGVVTTLAGTASGTGSVNGTGTAASFDTPFGLAHDNNGNLYVADESNSLIRMITPAGVVSTLAGSTVSGSADGNGTSASFFQPVGIATNSAGDVYVTDNGNETIRTITPTGMVSTLAGTAGTVGHADGSGGAASFHYPNGLVTDSTGNIFMADYGNATIRKITPTGVVTTFAGTAGTVGSADGTGAAASFNGPVGIAIDSANNLYVGDIGDNTIRKITPTGVVTTFAGTAGVTGHADGTRSAASFNQPYGLTADSADNIYVADRNNNLIRKITPTGEVSTLVGTAGVAGFIPGSLPGVIGYPDGVTVVGKLLYFSSANGIGVATLQ